jgi:hypothetical protein
MPLGVDQKKEAVGVGLRKQSENESHSSRVICEKVLREDLHKKEGGSLRFLQKERIQLVRPILPYSLSKEQNWVTNP